MAQQNINLGTGPDSYTGDSLNVAFTKANSNFTELYSGNAFSNIRANNIIANNSIRTDGDIRARSGEFMTNVTVIGNITALNYLDSRTGLNVSDIQGRIDAYLASASFTFTDIRTPGNISAGLPPNVGALSFRNTGDIFFSRLDTASNSYANTLTISGTTGLVTIPGDLVLGNLTVNNANIAGLVVTSGNITTNSNVEARSFIGNGRALTDVSAARVVGGETNIAGYGSAETSRITFSGRLVSEANLVTFQVPGIDGNSVITANGNVSINGNLITNSNVTAPYFIGNGALLTGISVDSAGILAANSEVRVNLDDTVTANISNNVKLSLNNTVLLANVDFIPEGDAVYSLGNSTNQWRELYVSQNTIYINRVPVSVRTVNNANVLYVNNNPVLSTNSNTAIETSANVTANVLTATTNIQSSGANLANVLFSGFGNVTANNVTISGNLTVLGDTTTLNVEQLSIEDKVITVGRNATTRSAADGSGIELAYGDAQGNVSILYSGAGTDDRWVMNRPLRAPNIISNTFVTANGNLSLNDNNITFIGNSGQGAGLHWSFETDFANIHFTGNNDASTNYLTFTVGDSGRDAEAFRWRQLRYDNVSFPAAELYANYNNSGLARLYLFGGLYANGVITTTGNISGGNLKVNANATVAGNITTANITVNSNLSVGGVSAFNNNVVVANTASLRTGNLTVNTNASIGGNLTVGNVLVTDGGVVTGNWRVQGTLTSVNQTQLTVDNINILVANGAQQRSDTNGAGLLVAVANANIVYDYANDSWDINKDFRLNGNNIYANNAFITTNVEIVSNTGYFVGNGRYLTGVQAFSAGDVRDYLPTHDANVNAAYYFGNGSQLTGMYGNLEVAAYLPENTSNVSAGNLAVAANISARNFSVNNSGSITGTLTVGSIQSANILDDFITVSTGSATPADTTGAGLRVALTDARLEYDQPRDTWLINRSLDAGDNDITAGNLSAAGISGDALIITGTAQAASVTATGNVTAANVVVGQTLTAQGNITTQSNVNAVGGTFTGAIHSNSLTVDSSVTGGSFSFASGNIYSSGNRIFTRHLLVNSEFTVTGAFGGNSVFRSPVINWDTFTQHGNATFNGNTTFSNNVAISANLSVSRLLSAYNLATTDTITAGGNITANGNIQAQIAGGSGGYILGNGRYLTGVTLSSLQNSWTRFSISDEGVPAFTDISTLGNNNVFWEVSNVGVMRGGGLNTTGNITTAASLVGNIIQANTSITTPGSVTANAVTANAVTVGDITANNFTTNSGIVENDLTVRGNLFVQGDRTIVNVQELAVEDINITIANGAVNATAANGAGFTIAGANVGLTYLSATNTQQLGSNVEVTGQLSVLGNINSANIVSTGNIATTANVSANFFVGNGRFLAGIDATLISNANASVRTLGSNSVVITLGDNVNSITAEGNGNITANGNVSASYFLGNGRLLSGIDTTLISSGSANVKTFDTNVVTVSLGESVNAVTYFGNGNITANGNVTASYFLGNGRLLSGIDTTLISSGLANVKTFDTNVVTVSLGNSVNAVTYFGNGNITANGNVSASYFLGNGRLLSGIDTTLISNGNTSVRVYADNNVTIQNASVNVASISREGYATFKTLTVSSDNPYEQSLALAQYSDFAGDGVDIIIERGRGNLTARANVQANDQLFHIWSNFYRGTGTARAMTIDNYITANGAANISLQLMNNNYSASSRVVEFQASNTLFTSNLTAANIHSTLNLVANVAQISGNITATANANIGNIVTGALSTTGNITTSANANIGNLTVVTNISANTIDGSGNITLANNRTIFMNNGTANISLGLLNIITTPADGEFLMYDAANAVWINATFDSGTY